MKINSSWSPIFKNDVTVKPGRKKGSCEPSCHFHPVPWTGPLGTTSKVYRVSTLLISEIATLRDPGWLFTLSVVTASQPEQGFHPPAGRAVPFTSQRRSRPSCPICLLAMPRRMLVISENSSVILHVPLNPCVYNIEISM